MSMETWKAEFYPVEADKVPAAEALAHTKAKWTGMLPENLAKHGIETLRGGRELFDPETYQCLMLGSESCALCTHYLGIGFCEGCPLMKAREARCDRKIGSWDVMPPWGEWTRNGDPRPMLALIVKAESL